ncbi:MAG: Tmc redox complex protein TmcD [Desulfobacula sp.]|nr:Tmc redox complex protein TmcD [Desulfobacula sp.]
MKQEQSWDWSTPLKQIPLNEWESRFNWVEDYRISLDGESVAAIVNLDEAVFSVCENGIVWDGEYEKAWGLQELPNGRFALMVSQDEEWTISISGNEWANKFDYIWNLQVSEDGSCIGVAVQQNMEYAMAVNDTPWENMFHNITDTTLNNYGASAGVVQIESMSAADINAFKKGVYSCAVNGNLQAGHFLNIWDISFDKAGENVAYAARLDREAYTIVQNDKPWDTNFQCVWRPLFTGYGSSVMAPVRLNGKWQLFKDGAPFWTNQYGQLWKVKPSPKPDNFAAIVSNQFGKWTICENDRPWSLQVDTMIPDLFYSKDGSVIVAPAKDKGRWGLLVNQEYWNLEADKILDPIISSSGEIVAAVIEKQGQWFLVVNNKIMPEGHDYMTLPSISPDESIIMQKAVKDRVYTRSLIPLNAITN